MNECVKLLTHVNFLGISKLSWRDVVYRQYYLKYQIYTNLQVKHVIKRTVQKLQPLKTLSTFSTVLLGFYLVNQNHTRIAHQYTQKPQSKKNSTQTHIFTIFHTAYNEIRRTVYI